MCFCNCNKLQEAMGAVSPLSSAKTSLNTNKEEHVVNANMRMEEKGN